MGKRTYHTCQDAGDLYCPCDLGLAGMCLACPALNGAGDCTDCAWSGTCVLVQAEHHNDLAPMERYEETVEVLSQKKLTPKAFVLTVKTPRYLLDSLRSPGSFVLLRPQRLPSRYNLPLTVAGINSEESTIDFLIQDVGIKSRALGRPLTQVVMRAPYRNGLVGIWRLWQRPGSRILIVAKGIAQGVAMRLGECLTSRGYNVDAALGPGEVGMILGKQHLESLGVNVIPMPRTRDRNHKQIGQLLKDNNYTALISAGSDNQHRSLAALTGSHRPQAAFVFTNNAIMSCAEGICGSCETSSEGGNFRACKASDWSLPGTRRDEW